MQEKIKQLEATIIDFYKEITIAPRLEESILYSIKAGGKRIRPLILLTLLESFGQEVLEGHYKIAAALEMIHTGSLIHDDLPAMDNDDYRRGQLTNHKQFDEATAILAGDSLFLDPFALIASAEDCTVEDRLEMVKELSLASGTNGMVSGQMLDIEGEGQALALEQLKQIHANKTGRLLTFPFWAAGRLVKLDAHHQAQLVKAGQLIGLAFQVRDDILDIEADFEEIGKTPQKDLLAEKATYPSLLGLEASKTYLADLLDEASEIFNSFEQELDFKAEAMENIIERLR